MSYQNRITISSKRKGASASQEDFIKLHLRKHRYKMSLNGVKCFEILSNPIKARYILSYHFNNVFWLCPVVKGLGMIPLRRFGCTLDAIWCPFVSFTALRGPFAVVVLCHFWSLGQPNHFAVPPWDRSLHMMLYLMSDGDVCKSKLEDW